MRSMCACARLAIFCMDAQWQYSWHAASSRPPGLYRIGAEVSRAAPPTCGGLMMLCSSSIAARELELAGQSFLFGVVVFLHTIGRGESELL